MLNLPVYKLAKPGPQTAHKLWVKTMDFAQGRYQVLGLGINSRVIRFLHTAYNPAFAQPRSITQQIGDVVYKHHPHSLLMKLKESKVII